MNIYKFMDQIDAPKYKKIRFYDLLNSWYFLSKS